MDGTDFMATFRTPQQAVELSARRRGPGADPRPRHPPAEPLVGRHAGLLPPAEDLAEEAPRDPLARMTGLLAEYGVDEDEAEGAGRADHCARSARPSDEAVAEPKLDPDTVHATHHRHARCNLRVATFRDNDANTLTPTTPAPSRSPCAT